MNEEKLSYFEARISNEIAGIEEKIKALRAEQSALTRQLAKAQADRTGLPEITRKNSRNKILAQNSILNTLRTFKKAVHSRKLYQEAKSTNYDLKENTFRSYLSRMRKEGLIKPSRKYTRCWVLPDDKEET